MNVRFTAEALEHISQIHEYIKLRNPEAASAVVARIRAAAGMLEYFPSLGHTGNAFDTKELTVKGLPYIIVYEVETKKRQIIILAVFHGAQDR